MEVEARVYHMYVTNNKTFGSFSVPRHLLTGDALNE